MRKIFCISLCLLLYSVVTYSQDNIITGKVTAADNTPLQGVTISATGSKNQTITDANGMYSINLPSNVTELVFTYVNTRSVNEKINGRKVIDVRMLTESVQLGEVVVVGYGTQKKQTSRVPLIKSHLKPLKTDLCLTLHRDCRVYYPILISGCLMENQTRLPGLIYVEQHP